MDNPLSHDKSSIFLRGFYTSKNHSPIPPPHCEIKTDRDGFFRERDLEEETLGKGGKKIFLTEINEP